MKLLRLDHAGIQVPDVRQAAAWYQQLLGLRQVYALDWGDHPAMMVTDGQTGLALFQTGTVQPHFAFGTDRSGFTAAQARLEQQGIAFDYQDHGPTESIYFADPYGHRLEITTTK